MIRLVARREITTRLQQRGYRYGLGIALLIVVLACVIPSFFTGDNGPKSYDVAVATNDARLSSSLATVARSEHVRITTHRATEATARTKVRDGTWDAAVVSGNRLVVTKSDAGVVGVVQDAFRLDQTLTRLGAAGVPASRARQALAVRPLTVRSTESAQTTQRQTLAVFTIIVLFSQLITFCTWVATGVVEEKASRVVELVLSSVRPLQLLAGKLLGIGVLAAGQVLLLGVAALVASTAAGTLSIGASGVLTVLVSFVSFVLGFSFFAALAAALGSTVSRQEEVSGVLTPVTLTITACYGLSFAVTSDPDSTLARVLSIVPPISCVAMPGRIARGGVPVIDVVLAVVLLALAAAAVTALAARVYRASVLHSGTRVSLRRAWRGEAVADLA